MIRRLEKWRSLPLKDRRLLIEAFVLMWRIRLMLWLRSFRGVKKYVAHELYKSRVCKLEYSPRGIGRFVERAARYVFRGTCLTQAFATQIILSRRGQPSDLRFGAKKAGGKFEAHAWVEVNGRIVVGEPAPGEFSDFQDKNV